MSRVEEDRGFLADKIGLAQGNFEEAAAGHKPNTIGAENKAGQDNWLRERDQKIDEIYASIKDIIHENVVGSNRQNGTLFFKEGLTSSDMRKIVGAVQERLRADGVSSTVGGYDRDGVSISHYGTQLMMEGNGGNSAAPLYIMQELGEIARTGDVEPARADFKYGSVLHGGTPARLDEVEGRPPIPTEPFKPPF